MDIVELLDDALDALQAQQRRADRTLTMIPSENSFSALAKVPYLTDAAHRYFFGPTGDPGIRRFPAGRDAGRVETMLTLPLLRHLTGAAHVNVRPLSGLHAMTLVMTALGGPPGATVITVHPELGGHYAAGAVAGRLALRAIYFGGRDPHCLDLDGLTALVAQHRPTLVYLDVQHGLFPIDVAATVAAVRAAGTATRVHADVSHTMGLVLGGALPNPLAAGADSFGGSTHKTFPGPPKAFIATNDAVVADAVGTAQYELISSHHLAAVCSLGFALAEFIACDGPGYAREVIAAAQALGAALHEAGLPPEAAHRGYTGCHQLWIRTTPTGVEAHTAAARLDRAGIHVNVLDDLPGLCGEPGLRLGTSEIITVGLTVGDMGRVARLMTEAIFGTRSASEVADDVAALRSSRRSRHRLPPESPPFRRAADLAAAILGQGLASPAGIGAR